MPADVSVYSMIRPPQVQDPLENYGRMVSIKSLMGNEQLNEMQREKLSRDMQEEQAFRNLFAGATPETMSAPDFLQRALAASPTRGITLQKSLLDQKKTQADLEKTQTETRAANAKEARDALAGVSDQASYQGFLDLAKQRGWQVANGAPPQFDAQWQKQHLATADKFIEQHTPKFEKAGDRFVDVNPVSNPNIGAARVGMTPAERANLEIKGAEATPGGVFGIPDIVNRYTRPGGAQPQPGYVTPAQLLNGGGSAPSTAPTAPAAQPAPAVRPASSGNPVQAAISSGKSGDELLATLPQAIGDQLKMMVQGRMPPPTGMALRTPYWQGMMTLATQYDPNFDETVWKTRNDTRSAFAKGTPAQNLTKINTAIGHLDSFDKAAQALDNGNYPVFNKIWNAIAPQVGGTKTAANIRTFEQAKEAVANEMMSVFRGVGASSSDTAKWAETLNAADSPQALRAAVKSATDLLESRIGALSEQYKRGMSTSSDVDVLNMVYPKSRATLERLKAGTPEQGTSGKIAPATGGIKFLGWEK